MRKIIDFLKKIFIWIKEFILKIFNKIKNYFKNGNYKKIFKTIKTKTIMFLGFIGSFISSIIPRKKESNVLSYINKVDKKIERIEKSIENETSLMVIRIYKKDINKNINKLNKLDNIEVREDVKLINKEIDKLKELEEKVIKVELSLVENKEENKKIKEKLDNIEKTNDKKIKEDNKIKEKNIKKSSINSLKKVTSVSKKGVAKLGNGTKKVISKTSSSSKKIIAKTSNGIKKSALFIGAIVFGIGNNKKKKRTVKKQVVKPNKQQKNQNKELIIKIKIINNEINDTYNKVAFLNNNKKLVELRILKEKVIHLRQEYILLTRNSKFKDLKKYRNINNIDPNHLVYHDKAFDDLINYLEISIKEERKKQMKPSFDNKEINIIKDSIKKDVELSMEEVIKIKKELKNIPAKNKRNILLNKLSSFFKYSISIGISLIPFGVFKNKLLATLTSGIILNNKIKSMKSIMDNDEIKFINYENILNNIRDRRSCLENTNYVLIDTVNEIDLLKEKIKIEFIDIEDKKLLLNDLDETKMDLLDEKKKIENMLEQYNNIGGKKIKQKIIS